MRSLSGGVRVVTEHTLGEYLVWYAGLCRMLDAFLACCVLHICRIDRIISRGLGWRIENLA